MRKPNSRKKGKDETRTSSKTTRDTQPKRAAAAATANEIQKLISEAKLSDTALTEIMLQCATALSTRRTVKLSGLEVAQARSAMCYLSFPNDPNVSLWQNGFKVGTTTLTEAQARGIPACG